MPSAEPVTASEEAPPQEAPQTAEQIKASQAKVQPEAAAEPVENGGAEAEPMQNGGEEMNGAEEEPKDELTRLREENASLKKRVEEQDKEIEGLKADKQKKKGGGFFARRKKPAGSATDGDQAAEATAATPEDEAKSPTDASGEEPAAEGAAAASTDEQSPEKKRKPGLKEKFGKKFGLFKPKGYEEQPTEQVEGEAAAAPFVVPDRPEVEWTVKKSFETLEVQSEPAAEGEEAAAPAEGEAAAEGGEPKKRECVFKTWSVEQVQEWLKDLQLESYSEACQWNGEQMLEITNAQFEKELGVKNVMHRKKLRLTLNALASGEEMPCNLFDWDIKACVELMQYHGLPQYVVETFVADSVDGRVLTFLTPDDLITMKITTPFVQSAIKRAAQLLRQNNYTREHMKTFVEPEAEPVPEEPVQEAAAEEPAPEAEAAAADGAAASEPAAEAAAATEDKPTNGEEGEGEAAAAAEGGEEKTEEAAATPAEKTEAELKAEEDARAAEEAKKKEEEERRKQEAEKERQRRHFLRCAEALKEQKPLLTWSNSDVVVWARSVELVDLAPKILGSGVSGAFIVLDTCFTGESMCSVLGIPTKSPQKAEVIAKFQELIGEEVAAEKTEASKCEGYTALIAGQKAKRKRSLSFSGAIRRRNRTATNTAAQQQCQFLLTFEDGSDAFVTAHTKDCSAPKPPPPEPAKAEEPKEAAAEETAEGGAAAAEAAKDEASPADDEKAPLVEDAEAEAAPAAEEAPAAAAAEPEAPKEEEAAPAAEAEAEAEAAPAEKAPEKTSEDVDHDEQKLLDTADNA